MLFAPLRNVLDRKVEGEGREKKVDRSSLLLMDRKLLSTRTDFSSFVHTGIFI